MITVDAGKAENLTTSTLQGDAFIFDPRGLMAGMSIEGTKVTRVREGRTKSLRAQLWVLTCR